MKQEILDYIKTQPAGVLAVEMLDGSPHGATVHFAHAGDPLMFFFLSDRNYRKTEPLLQNGKTRASFVLGVDESNMKTFQTDGEVSILTDNEQTAFNDIYFAKFPDKKHYLKDSSVLFFKFTPKWWRFTDWTGPEGKTITES